MDQILTPAAVGNADAPRRRVWVVAVNCPFTVLANKPATGGLIAHLGIKRGAKPR